MAQENAKSLKQSTRVWEFPIRIWHWAFAVALSTALLSGWYTDWNVPQIHGIAGISVFSLLIFRLLWGFCGSIHTRWKQYRTTPSEFIDHFQQDSISRVHSAPGIVLVVLLMLATLGQSSMGLITTDDIFFEGPLFDLVDEEYSDLARWIHHRLWWLITALVGTHLLANVTYLVILRDTLPLSMFHGKKNLVAEPADAHPMRALICLFVAVCVFATLFYHFDSY